MTNEITELILKADGINGNKEKAISMMIKENSGKQLCDSGGIYGYAYEKYADVDFEKEPSAKITINKNGELEILKSTYHLLTWQLDITKASKQIERNLWGVIESNDESYNENIKEWWQNTAENVIKYTDENGDECELELENEGSFYTYNMDNMIDLDIVCYLMKDFHTNDKYVILKIHNGCDARAGFSSPHVFAFSDLDGYDCMIWELTNYSLAIFFDDQHIYYDTHDGGYSFDAEEWTDGIPDSDSFKDISEFIMEKVWGCKENFDVNNVNIEEKIINIYESEYYPDIKSITIDACIDGGSISIKGCE